MPFQRSYPQRTKKLLRTYTYYIKDCRKCAKKRVKLQKRFFHTHQHLQVPQQQAFDFSSISSFFTNSSFSSGTGSSSEHDSDDNSDHLSVSGSDLVSISTILSEDEGVEGSESGSSDMDASDLDMELESDSGPEDGHKALRDSVIGEIKMMYKHRYEVERKHIERLKESRPCCNPIYKPSREAPELIYKPYRGTHAVHSNALGAPPGSHAGLSRYTATCYIHNFFPFTLLCPYFGVGPTPDSHWRKTFFQLGSDTLSDYAQTIFFQLSFVSRIFPDDRIHSDYLRMVGRCYPSLEFIFCIPVVPEWSKPNEINFPAFYPSLEFIFCIPVAPAWSKSQTTKEPVKRGAPSKYGEKQEKWLEEKMLEYLEINDRKEKTRWLNRAVDAWFEAWPYHTLAEPEEFQVLAYLEGKGKGVSNAASTGKSDASVSLNDTLSSTTTNQSATGSDSNVTVTTSAPSNDVSTSPATTHGSSITATPSANPNEVPSDSAGDSREEVDQKLEDELNSLSPEALEDLRLRRKELRASIAANKGYRQINTASGARNPFNNWFTQIRQMGSESTRAIPDYQWYLKHELYGQKVKGVFDSKWKDMDKEEKYRLHYLCETAKEMLSKEPEEVRKKLDEENAKDHHRRLQRVEKLLSGDSEEMTVEASKNPEVQQACRQMFGLVAQPMMDCVRSHTDYFCFTVAGRAPAPGESKFELAVIDQSYSYSSGTTVPRDGGKGLKVHEFKPEQFKTQVLNYFMDFLLETSTDAVPPQGLTHVLATKTPDDLTNPVNDPNMLSFDNKDTEPEGNQSQGSVSHDKGKGKKTGKAKKVEVREKGRKEEIAKAGKEGKGKEVRGKKGRGKGKKSKESEESEAESSGAEEDDPQSNGEGWLPAAILDALNRLSPSDLKIVLKDLQAAADTKNVVEFNRAVMRFTRDFPAHVADVARLEDTRRNVDETEERSVDETERSRKDEAWTAWLNETNEQGQNGDTSSLTHSTPPEIQSQHEQTPSSTTGPQSTELVEIQSQHEQTPSSTTGPQSTELVVIANQSRNDLPAGATVDLSSGGGIALTDEITPSASGTVSEHVDSSVLASSKSSGENSPGAGDTGAVPESLGSPISPGPKSSNENCRGPSGNGSGAGNDDIRGDNDDVNGEAHDMVLSDQLSKFDRNGWPSWMSVAASYLEESLEGIGDVGPTLLYEWFVFERWHNYDNPKNACYTSVGRPVAIGVWFKSGKKFRNFTPKEWKDAKIDTLPDSWLL
ncbi:hypothetical protein K435DRAFT_802310 [Dendrothele bispora CBS 962.96]|uniref:Uncharacterized protein n=1 Tax=Dendrothele bispora (strain CBS 962.96) TaxID=1314807 RepID=A0A4S8LLF3_DENBC|nr:hypothetical protein K435DRAFT_802310 [Dendrothele bispora CBS 962.96]